MSINKNLNTLRIKENLKPNKFELAKLLIESRQKVAGIGCMATKAGMTTWFLPTGEAIACTVVVFEGGNKVTMIKKKESDGYNAIQIGYKFAKNIKKAEMGHLKKAGAPALRHLREYKMDDLPEVQIGETLDISTIFQEGDLVDVAGTSIGKGFQGGIKRWNMHRGPMTHGSKSHRAPGSIGARYSGGGGRVMPGLKMPGHMGNKRVTIRKLQILKIDKELNAIVIKGAVPGKPGNTLSLTPAKILGKNFLLSNK